MSITVPIVAVFTFSAIETLKREIEKARKFTKLGFVMTIGFMVFLATVNIINLVAPDLWQTTHLLLLSLSQIIIVLQAIANL